MGRSKVEGMNELIRIIKRLEKLPQKCVTTAARKGATIPKNASKAGGWIDQSGQMRKGIILKGEKSRIKGKKVYEVTMDPKMNDSFVKISKAGTRYYYPASQEYGFRTKNGGYVPGFHFMRKAMEENKSKIEKEIVDVLSKEIDKLK
jgi:HK97 gp10 family phage protein